MNLEWRTNLRGNLDLWPSISTNIQAMMGRDGQEYDEAAMLAAIPKSADGKSPEDTRTVRNTFEILALSGLAHKTADAAPLFRLTNLGRSTATFLGALGEKRFANEANRHLVASQLIRGLAVVAEIRAIWTLMRKTGNQLTNEELNRVMPHLKMFESIGPVAESVLNSRMKADPKLIGPRLYEDDKFGTDKESDQRKAINPIFLLAGGGRLFLRLDQSTELRTLESWAVPIIDDQLRRDVVLIHASTDARDAAYISTASGARLPNKN